MHTRVDEASRAALTELLRLVRQVHLDHSGRVRRRLHSDRVRRDQLQHTNGHKLHGDLFISFPSTAQAEKEHKASGEQ